MRTSVQYPSKSSHCEKPQGSFLGVVLLGLVVGLAFSSLSLWSGLGIALSLVVCSVVGTSSVLAAMLLVAWQSSQGAYAAIERHEVAQPTLGPTTAK